MSKIITNFITNIDLKQEPLIIYGKSGTGKTFLINKIKNKVGNDKVVNINLNNLLKNGTPNLAQIHGKKLAIIEYDDCKHENININILIQKLKNKEFGYMRHLMSNNESLIEAGNFIISKASDCNMNEETKQFINNYSNCINIDSYPNYSINFV